MSPPVVKNPEAVKIDSKKAAETHKKTAEHHEAAAKHHVQAAKHHEAGEVEKAAHSTMTAHGHSTLANEMQKDNTKHYAAATNKTPQA